MFTISYICNDHVSKNLAEVRTISSENESQGDAEAFPDPDSHAQHVARVSYRVYTLLKCNEPDASIHASIVRRRHATTCSCVQAITHYGNLQLGGLCLHFADGLQKMVWLSNRTSRRQC